MSDSQLAASVLALLDGTADTFLVCAGAGSVVSQKTVAQVLTLLSVSTTAQISAAYLPLTGGSLTGNLAVANSASNTITVNSVFGMTVSKTGTITNNTSNGLYNTALKITNDATLAGSFGTVNVGLQIAHTTAESIGVAIVGTQKTAIFIGPTQLVTSSPLSCVLHSTSTATRQFLFNNSVVGTSATDGTYFSQATTGEFTIINQESAALNLYAGNGVASLILSPSTQSAMVNWTTTTIIGLVVKAPASQSANLQEWQSSAGTVLASVSAAGNFTAAGLMCCGVYTFATVPSASSNTGKFLRISDRAQKHAYSDGTNWRFFGDDAVIS